MTHSIVELLGRGNEVLRRVRAPMLAGDALRIGRGYDTDFQLDDVYVAAEHLRLSRDAEGRLWAEDCSSRNGLRDHRGRALAQRIEVADALELQVGHSRLRIFNGLPLVPAERLLPAGSANPWVAFAWLSLAILAALAADWLQITGEIPRQQLVVGGVVAIIFTIGWSFLWSLATRVFTHQLRFSRHLRIAAVGSLAASLLVLLIDQTAFSFNWSGLRHYAYLLYWSAFAVVVWLHLRAVTAGHLLLKGLVVAALAGSAITLQGLDDWVVPEPDQQEASFLDRLAPASTRLAATQTLNQFIQNAAALEAELQQLRSEAAQREQLPAAGQAVSSEE